MISCNVSAQTAKLRMSWDDLLFSILKQTGGHADIPTSGHIMLKYSKS